MNAPRFFGGGTEWPANAMDPALRREMARAERIAAGQASVKRMIARINADMHQMPEPEDVSGLNGWHIGAVIAGGFIWGAVIAAFITGG